MNAANDLNTKNVKSGRVRSPQQYNKENFLLTRKRLVDILLLFVAKK